MMELIKITFKKVGNHWYPNIKHENPSDLKIDSRLEELLNNKDEWNEGVVNITLMEQSSFIVEEGLIQFDDADLLRYFTTDDKFDMALYIENKKYTISSSLYSLLEREFHADFHEVAYRISEYEV
jgi:hypothetical protein